VLHNMNLHMRRRGAPDGHAPLQETDALWTARAIAANMADAVGVIRASDGVMLYTNASWDTLLGYSAGELTGRHVAVVNAPTELTPEERANEIASALERDGAWRGVVRNLRKDGSRLWCDAAVSEFRHPEQGQVWLSVLRETTERVEAAETLRSAKDRYQEAFEQTPVPTALLSEDRRVVDANAAFCELTGYDARDLLDKPLADITHPDDAASDAGERRLIGTAGEEVPATLTDLVVTATGRAGTPPSPPGSRADRAGDP
jgi:PAS domain S-box-containing protein